MGKLFIRKSGIQNKLLFSYFLLLVFIVGIIGVAVYKISEAIIVNQVGRSRLEVLEQIGRNVNIIIDEIISVSNIYYCNDTLIKMINKPPAEDNYEKNIDANKVMEIFSRYTYVFDNLKYYSVLYAYSGRAYTSWINNTYKFENVLRQPWYPKILARDGKILWVSTFNDKECYGEDKYVFSAARLLKHYYSDKPLGVLLLNVDEAVLQNTYHNALNSGNKIYIIDKSGNIVSHPEKAMLGSNIGKEKQLQKILFSPPSGNFTFRRAGTRFLSTIYPIAKPGWFIIEELPFPRVLAPMNKMKYFTLLLLGLGMLVGFGMSYLIARRITLPVQTLYRSMQQVENGDLNVVTEVRTVDEIGELSKGFNNMLAKIRDLMRNVQAEEKLKRKAELEFLQAQINPHFLYNTLTSIRCMVEMKQNKDAQNMLLALVRLLRNSIGNSDEFVSVRKQLENLQDYLLIQSFRYPDKFTVGYMIQSEVFDCQIPKLILQPLVENAIFHGIEPKETTGRIKISGYQDEADLVFEVSDDGVGMNEEQLRAIWEKKDKPLNRTFNRIGIINVHERLALNFGPSYGLKIFSQPGAGTAAVIRMPVFRNGEEGEIGESFDRG
jgi:two-component system sensor histidine kinase YesM